MLAARLNGFDQLAPTTEFEPSEVFVLDEVLQLVAERAVAITGADGLAIALAEDNEIVLRAAAGTVRPDVGARIDRDSAFSGACFRTAQVINSNDTETDARVNLVACRRLGARSMVAVPLCGRRRVIGLLEAFSAEPFGFNDSDIRNLTLLAELVLGALKPEDEDRFARSAQAAESKLSGTEDRLTATGAPSAQEPVAPVSEAPLSEVKTVAPPEIAKPSPPASAVTIEPKLPAAPTTVPIHAARPIPAPAKLESRELASSAPPALKSAVPQEAKLPTTAPTTIAHPTVEEKTAPTVPEAAIPAPTFPELAANADLDKDDRPSGTAAPEVTNVESIRGVLSLRLNSDAAASQPVSEEESPWRTRILLALACAIVIAGFAGGVWWKLKNSKPAPANIANATPSKQETRPAAPQAPPNTATSSATPTATDENQDEDAAENSTASPDELNKFPHITGIRHWSSADSSTVVLDLEDQVQYEAHRLANPDRIYFDLHDTQLSPDLAGKSIEIGDSFLNRVRIAQPVAGMTRVVLEPKPNTNFSVSLETNPYRLVVEIHKVGAAPKTSVNLFPNSGNSQNKVAIVVPPPTKEDLQLRARLPKLRIVVDAGHGGWDLGTVGRRGLLEKDVVLEIAQRLGKLLETRLGADVILTRNDDTYVPLDERAAIANQAQADFFISVHANYSDLPSARGVETYYTNTFTTPGAKDLDTRAGAATSTNLSLTPADLHDRIEQSRKLAASVQRSLYGTLALENPGLRDRGVKEAGFVVLTESAMPGILAEVSFVSSPTDEQKLRSDGYREEIAEALYKGIARYAANTKSMKLASASK